MSHGLVIGAGDPAHGDHGVGRRVVEELQRAPPAGAVSMHLADLPADLFLLWTEEMTVLLVGAVTSGAPPGTIHRCDARAGPLPPRVFRRTGRPEALGIAEVVGLARALDRLPATLEVWGIEGLAFEQPGLSPAVEAAALEVARDILARLAG